jgi:hypothetical protein
MGEVSFLNKRSAKWCFTVFISMSFKIALNIFSQLTDFVVV